MRASSGLKLSALVVVVAVVGYFAAFALAQQCPGGLCNGGSGDDTLAGTPDYDNINGQGGDDTVRGYAWFDELDGGQGADLGEGGNNRDAVIGGDGWDTLRGNDDNDYPGVLARGGVRGEAGNDQISGSEGYDLCKGGGGNDDFNATCEEAEP